MRFTSFAAALAAAGSALAQSSLTINTPTALYTCQPFLLTWSGGQAPYYIRVFQGGSQSDLLETLLSSTSETSYTWNVNLAASTSVTLGMTDSTGASAFTAPVTISDSGDSSCVGSSSSGSSSAAAGSSSSSAAASSSSSSSRAATSATTASSSASSASSAASSVSSSVSSAVSSVSSSVSSRVSSATSSATNTATGSAPSASPSDTSAANSVKAGSALALVAGVIALAA
ncbi:hypothetical protein JCM11641_001319 [Rhodosporidiobolus odoratus]